MTHYVQEREARVVLCLLEMSTYWLRLNNTRFPLLQSLNGTLVNGARISKACRLTAGDTVQIGASCLHVQVSEGERTQSHDTLSPEPPGTWNRSLQPRQVVKVWRQSSELPFWNCPKSWNARRKRRRREPNLPV